MSPLKMSPLPSSLCISLSLNMPIQIYIIDNLRDLLNVHIAEKNKKKCDVYF